MTETHLSGFYNGNLFFDVIDRGPREAEPVVLLHGFPQTAASWDSVGQLLNQRGLRTLAPNQRGYAVHARPRGRGAYRLPNLVGDTVRLIEEIGQPVHLVGHDWGAAVAWMIAAGHPDRVQTLTTVSVPHPGAFLKSMLSSRQALKSFYMALFQLPLLPELALRFIPGAANAVLAAAGMDRTQRDNTRRDVIHGGALSGGLNWYRALPLGPFGSLNTPVRVPTTHVWSDRDVALDRKGAELTGRYVRAPFTMVALHRANHWVPEHHPERLAGIIATTTQQADAQTTDA